MYFEDLELELCSWYEGKLLHAFIKYPDCILEQKGQRRGWGSGGRHGLIFLERLRTEDPIQRYSIRKKKRSNRNLIFNSGATIFLNSNFHFHVFLCKDEAFQDHMGFRDTCFVLGGGFLPMY